MIFFFLLSGVHSNLHVVVVVVVVVAVIIIFIIIIIIIIIIFFSVSDKFWLSYMAN